MSVGPIVATAEAVTNTTPPIITNNAWATETLSLTQGSYDAPTLSVADEWFQCTNSAGTSCSDTSMSGSTYALTGNDDGFYMKVTETATGLDLTSTVTDSNVTRFPVQPQAPSSTVPPSISDSTSHSSVVTQADTLTATDGSWSEPPDSINRQWERCDSTSCAPISGATGTTYVPVRVDVSDSIKLVEAPVYGPTTLSGAESSGTPLVLGRPPVNNSPPTISPLTASAGQTLTATTGSWSNDPSGYLYQWQRCDQACTDIDGATQSSYVVSANDAGYALKVRVDAFVGAIANTTADSAPDYPSVPANVSAPSISGGLLQGQLLTADPGTWTLDPGNRYVYQWQDCDSSGTGCQAIAGATSPTYTTIESDVGHTLVVAVNGVNSGGTGPAAFSGPGGLIVTSSTTSIGASPAAPVTNTPVMLTATVTSGAAGVVPSGTVGFSNGSGPIAGCAAQPLSVTGQAATATCQTSFGAGVAQLSAAYVPSGTSAVTGSVSPQARVFVGRVATTTSLDVTSKVKVAQRTTFTATVAHASLPGPLTPVGTVEFMDAGKPIAGCARQPLVAGGATCTTEYAKRGGHSIRARFGGDSNFLSSSSPIRPLRAMALAVKGRITSTMQWTFHYTPTYTEVVAMVINGVPRGGVVHARCTGKGCPFSSRTTTVRKAKRCVKRKRSTCPPPGRVSLTGPFRHHRLEVGAQITIVVQRSQYVGKYYSFLVRARRQPRVSIDCLAVDGTKPGVGC